MTDDLPVSDRALMGRSAMTNHASYRLLLSYGWSRDAATRHLDRWYDVSRKRLARLSEAQGHRCAYCQSPTWLNGIDPKGWPNLQATIDHYVPRSMGGSESRFNKIMACSGCNGTRGSRDADEFLQWLWARWGPGVPMDVKNFLKRTARIRRRSVGSSGSERYGGLVLCLALLMDADEEYGKLVDDILPGGRKHRKSMLDRRLKVYGISPGTYDEDYALRTQVPVQSNET